jgi:hypothetical protein
VASVNVAGRENGMSRRERRQAVTQAVTGYRFNAARLSEVGGAGIVMPTFRLMGHRLIN